MAEIEHVPGKELSGKAMRRVVMGSFAGALMEWYDFFYFRNGGRASLCSPVFP